MSELRRDPEVAQASRPQPSRDGPAALITVVPRHDPESPSADALVERLRADSGALAGVAEVHVGGATAFNTDFIDLVSGSMWKILLFVLVFSYLVLFVLLRSVLLPLKAVLMNLLSVAAAYGVLVMVFQYGWFDGVLGFDSLGYVNAMTPPFLLAIVFGLSMDYEVFLLSRIRERYDATGDTKASVAQGLRASAGTISSAALIMVAVFAVFAGTGTPSIKEIGVGMSVAIALDATLVRLVLVPATMEIMGRWNWWLPPRARPRAAARRFREREPLSPRAGARPRPLARSPRCAPARACRGRAGSRCRPPSSGGRRSLPTACRSRPGGGSACRSSRRCRIRPGPAPAQLLVDGARLLRLAVLVHERQHGDLDRRHVRI